MSLPDYVYRYKTHDWKVYRLSSEEWQKLQQLLKSEGLLPHKFCNSESQRAEELKDDPDRFYVDWERLAADFDPTRGGDVQALKESWRGHPADSLVMYVYDDVFLRGEGITIAVARDPVV